MNRRELLGGLAATIGLSGIAMAKQEPTLSYTYDWSVTPPHTDDPKWAGKLRRGKHNHAFCDGVEITGSVVAYRTGKDGFVERFKRDAKGNMLIHPQIKCIVRERFVGYVEYRPDA